MAFYIDNQTLEDINVFGKKGRASVFNLYNVTKTRGGAKILENIFRYPLSDERAINRRSSIIRHMMDSGVEFSFSGELFDTIEHYLANIDTRTKLIVEDNFVQRKLKGAVGADNEYKQLHKGLLAIIEILHLLHVFAGKMELDSFKSPYHEELEKVYSLLRDPELRPFLDKLEAKKMSFSKTAELDTLARFKVREKLLGILDYIYHLDVYIAVATVASRLGFSFAAALPSYSTQLDVEGMYHPMVNNAVPNTIKTDENGNVLFLTGANMAGKSTFMKTLGLTMFLAHAGFPVPVKKMKFSVLDGMFTTINLPDNLGTGFSHFYAEVMRVKKVAGHLGKSKRLLVIFDELFRGTNVKDAYDATVAIAEAFATRLDCLFVISTHIIEAGEILRSRSKNVRFIYLPTIMEGTTAKYTYTLNEGITTDRHGMMIVNNENVLNILGSDKAIKESSQNPIKRFAVDKQTLEDLNLLGEFRPDSIFNIYKCARTRGGKALLEEMFLNPLTDAGLINERIDLFKYFQDEKHSFLPNNEVFERAEQYLQFAGQGSAATSLINMGQKLLMQYLANDREFQMIKEGLAAAVTLIAHFKIYVSQLNRKDLPSSMLPAIENLDRLFSDKKLLWISKDESGEITWRQIAKHDYLLRRVYHQEMQQLLKTLYEIDLYTSVGELASKRGFVFPDAIPFNTMDNQISIDQFYHPGLPGAVANHITISKEKNVIFLTGANMAGKSTLMKAFSVSVYLAHMGFPIAAKSMKFSVQDGIYTSINVSDNLTLGHSHFYAEVLRVKHIAKEVAEGKKLVVVFDELFKGTNVQDAFDATLAATAAFGGHRDCSYVISTHIIEVGEALREGGNNFQFSYLPTIMEGVVPRYTYKLTNGITEDRQGMIIINNEKILELITDRPQ